MTRKPYTPPLQILYHPMFTMGGVLRAADLPPSFDPVEDGTALQLWVLRFGSAYKRQDRLVANWCELTGEEPMDMIDFIVMCFANKRSVK